MKRVLTVFLTLTLGWPLHAHEGDRLQTALNQLRGHVNFVDFSDAGRVMSFGETLMNGGARAMIEIPDTLDYARDEDDLRVVAIFGLVALAIWGIGGAIKVSGRIKKNQEPERRLDQSRASHYMTAKGLNQFMEFTEDEQFEYASKEPELAAFLIKLNDAYTLVTEYRLLP